MERLTKLNEKGMAYLPPENSGSFSSSEWVGRPISKLAAYEDLGYEPEELKIILGTNENKLEQIKLLNKLLIKKQEDYLFGENL